MCDSFYIYLLWLYISKWPIMCFAQESRVRGQGLGMNNIFLYRCGGLYSIYDAPMNCANLHFSSSKTSSHHKRISSSLPFAAFLLSPNDLEGRIGLLLDGRWTLFRDFAPPTSSFVFGGVIRRCEGWIGSRIRDDASISQLSTFDEFFCKSPAVKGLRGCVNGIGYDVRIGRHKKQRVHKTVD